MSLGIPLRLTKCFQGVYHCGHHSEKSYGAASYFITRPEGNILIDRYFRTSVVVSLDLHIYYFQKYIVRYWRTFSVYVTYLLLICSPRYTKELASNIKKLGGARYMFLTHKYAEYTSYLLVSNICDINSCFQGWCCRSL